MKPYEKTEAELFPYIGTMKQLAGIRTSVLDDGRGRGIRIAEVNNGSGLRFTVLLDRGMDIGEASYNGIPVAYQSPVGAVHPAYYNADGANWLRSFGGGLLTGCGLQNVGTPSKGEGLHGRLSNIPAENISIRQEWKNGRYELSVAGIVKEVGFFGENLELRRTISTMFGDNTITIADDVVNCGVRPSPLMLLYHINAGFPLLDEHAVLAGNVKSTVSRTENAAAGIGEWNRCQPPAKGYVEQCFFHDVEPDADGMARMTLKNPRTGISMTVAYRKNELPYFTQWKMMGQQEYVMGLEPANCHPDGQVAERKNRTLKTILPGNKTRFTVLINFRTIPMLSEPLPVFTCGAIR
ncbi:MAG: aldose 1-epimerase family protein [Kiritimatiellales bacterium]